MVYDELGFDSVHVLSELINKILSICTFATFIHFSYMYVLSGDYCFKRNKNCEQQFIFEDTGF